MDDAVQMAQIQDFVIGGKSADIARANFERKNVRRRNPCVVKLLAILNEEIVTRYFGLFLLRLC